MHEDTDAIGFQKPKKGGSAVLAWLLLFAALAGTVYLFITKHAPLVEELQKKDAALSEASRKEADARKELEAANAAKAEAEAALDKAKAELAQSASKNAEDDKLLGELKSKLSGADVQGQGGQITVTMVDKILFKSGEAALTPQGEELLKKLGDVLTSVDKLIEVSGHADNQPVESAIKAQYPTNWELSTARATNVVRFLQEKVGIKGRRLKASGYGESRPVASNASAKGRARNRRIEILLLPDVKVVKGEIPKKPEVAKADVKPDKADAKPDAKPIAKKDKPARKKK